MSMINAVMTVIIGTILLVAVAIPLTVDTIASANLTGTTGTVVGYIPLFLGIAALVLAIAMIR